MLKQLESWQLHVKVQNLGRQHGLCKTPGKTDDPSARSQRLSMGSPSDPQKLETLSFRGSPRGSGCYRYGKTGSPEGRIGRPLAPGGFSFAIGQRKESLQLSASGENDRG